tara:strand:+ start:40440 stop:41243 length:804 start_codon:yes stop_codon:yes gene_type:complete
MTDLVPFNYVDYLEEARSGVTEQFKNKDIFDRFLETLMDGYADIESCLQDLMQLRDLDNAIGAQLDVIGEIVGQPRLLLEADLFTYFGFQGALGADSFGSTSGTLGGQFYSLGDSYGGNILLNDDIYRQFIKAKIFKNSFTSTPEEFITAINQIFGTTTTFISIDQDGYAVVFFGRPLSEFERVLIGYIFEDDDYPVRLIPKTVGVKLDFGQFDADNYFGFQGAPGARGFGDLPNQVGGYGYSYGLSYGQIESIDISDEGGFFAQLL